MQQEHTYVCFLYIAGVERTNKCPEALCLAVTSSLHTAVPWLHGGWVLLSPTTAGTGHQHTPALWGVRSWDFFTSKICCFFGFLLPVGDGKDDFSLCS